MFENLSKISFKGGLKLLLIVLAFSPQMVVAQRVEPLPFGDMESWLSREIKESPLIGGGVKTIYELAVPRGIERNVPYSDAKFSRSIWATSSVFAHVSGIQKGSVTVTPIRRDGGKAALLECKMEQVKVLGVINISAMATGTIFTGEVIEPIRNTKNPQAKLSSGIPFTKRPKFLQFDYKVDPKSERLYDNGLSKTRRVGNGADNAAEACIILQKRWENDKGEIFAQRIATGWERFSKAQSAWQNNHRIPLKYGDISSSEGFKPFMGLFTQDPIYTLNSRGEMVEVQEIGWADAKTTPTHLFVRFSASYGGAYVGAEDASFAIDNVALGY